MYIYKHFIHENAAPKGAKRIGVYRGDERICTVPLGRLAPVEKEPLYSFGLLSDLHILYFTSDIFQQIPKFDNALTLFENNGCSFCVVCGDLTNTGFYLRADEGTAGTEVIDKRQMENYKGICDKHTIPVYEICGNHESYYDMPITKNLDLLGTYTGKDVLSYTVEQGNDLFIFCGQNRMLQVMSDDDFTWLSNILAENKDKRCFVFIHSFIDKDSGNPLNIQKNSIFNYQTTTNSASNKESFIRLMASYKNSVVFHGHSHMKFESQEFDASANYTEKNGFRSVHIPSCGSPRDIDFETMKSKDDLSASQGYIVDVYDDCIVLNGLDFVNEKPVPLGTYKLDTALKTVEADTFTDDTGIIVT